MNWNRVFVRTATGLAIVACGCGQQAMPKGTGASGKVATVAAAANDRLDLINKLTADQQRAFDRMHESFAKTFDAKTTKPPKGFASVEAFQKAWDDFKFADIGSDRRHV